MLHSSKVKEGFLIVCLGDSISGLDPAFCRNQE